MLPRVTGEALLRFKQEFRAAQDLAHPNLVRLGELFEEDGQWFFTMELVRGGDFLTHVRPGTASPVARTEQQPASESVCAPAGTLDEPRLRRTVAATCGALGALHAAGLVHRDLKPSNLLVTSAGRVVVLDLGLVQVADERPTGDAIVGTVAYMAPEQAAQAAIGPPADLYALGVMIYEALTGQFPFSGPALSVLMQEQKAGPTAPSALGSHVARDLDVLCMALLARDPASRPHALEVATRIQPSLGEPDAARGSPSMSARHELFVGRARELLVLATAFDEVQSGRARAVLVEGESGVGKTALVHRFTDTLRDGGRDPIVLHGRCYERESVPYKAWDGVLDALSRHAQRLSDLEVGTFAPRQAALLVQVFPVLGWVRGFSEAAARARPAGSDPQEQRTRLFGAVRELLGRLGDRRPLVVLMDDLQWADRDSFALMEEVLREPEAPRLLLVGTARTLPDHATDVRRRLDVLTVGALSEAEATDLAGQLLATVPASERPSAVEVAREAGGHPLFVDELARFSRGRGILRLDDALIARVRELPAEARRVLELLAVAGSPIERTTLVAASGTTDEPLERAIALLRAGRLLRGDRSGGAVEPYHDRVREAVAGSVAPDARLECHLALAHALESSGDADPDVLALHWRAAGQAPRAVPHYLRAAKGAETALAFDRAAACYRAALELAPEHPERRRLQVGLADALADAGRGGKAALEYGRAAVEALEPRAAMRFERLAVENHLKAGDLAAGRVGTRKALATVSLKAPRSALGALIRLLLWRARLRLRGLGFAVRAAGEVPVGELDRIDTCWSVGTYLISVDMVQGMMWTTRALLLSLEAGEPTRIARSLAAVAFSQVFLGRELIPRARRIFEVQHPLVRTGADPYGWALSRLVEAAILLFGLGRWREGLERSEEACRALRDDCTGASWEAVATDCYRIFCLHFLGRLREMHAVQSACLLDAERKGDLCGTTFFSTSPGSYGRLARDDPDGSFREARSAVAAWSIATSSRRTSSLRTTEG